MEYNLRSTIWLKSSKVTHHHRFYVVDVDGVVHPLSLNWFPDSLIRYHQPIVPIQHRLTVQPNHRNGPSSTVDDVERLVRFVSMIQLKWSEIKKIENRSPIPWTNWPSVLMSTGFIGILIVDRLVGRSCRRCRSSFSSFIFICAKTRACSEAAKPATKICEVFFCKILKRHKEKPSHLRVAEPIHSFAGVGDPHPNGFSLLL